MTSLSADTWIRGLNPEQKTAVCHVKGPLLILAGAGSGKTTVLVSRTGNLISEGHATARQICVLTFTNKAARELKNRVAAKLGNQGKDVWAGTFHSFGLLILKQFYKEAGLPKGFGILDSADSQAIIKELLKDLVLVEKADFDAGKLLSILGTWRARGQTTARNGEDPYEIAAQWLLPKFKKRLRKLGVVDFDELLLRPLALFEKHPEIKEKVQSSFKHVMVDEFQDTNRTQMELVKVLVEPHQNITVVGDDDQSIYGWRGAEIENILTFPRLYQDCQVIRLERNYRSTPSILKLANEVISKNTKRHGKVLKPNPDVEEGPLPEVFVYENESEEVERIVADIEQKIKKGRAFQDCAILYRSNSLGALFEAELRRVGIPHRVTGGTGFFERKEVKDVLAYLRCAIRPNEVALRRILNTPQRGVGETSIEKLSQFAEAQKISLYQAAKRWKEAEVPEKTGEGLDQMFRFLEKLIPDLLNISTHAMASQRLLRLFEELGYKTFIEKYARNAQQAQHRWKLLEIFGNVLDKFFAKGGVSKKTVKEFVECMELRDEVDDGEDTNKVQLLTLHGCKGLEFPVVYLAGIEEDILPHKTLGSDVSEERRLFYVGVTRAKEELMLSRARTRQKYGKACQCAPSRFLLELPQSCYKEYGLGFRPVSETERTSMLSDLFNKIDKISEEDTPLES